MTDRDKGQILQWWQGCRRGCEPRLCLGSRSQVFSAFLAPSWILGGDHLGSVRLLHFKFADR